MEGDLRVEVEQRFGEFLAGQHFKEVFYSYSEQVFGNEILDFSSGDLILRFSRDRSQIVIDLKTAASDEFQPIHMLLRRLGIDEPPFPGLETPPPTGFLFGADQLIPEWPRLLRLLLGQPN